MIAPKPKPKQPTPEAAAAFIAGAPDAPGAKSPAAKPKVPRAPKGQRARPVLKGQREQISITVPLGTVDQIDAAAKRLGVTRAAFINFAIARALGQ